MGISLSQVQEEENPEPFKRSATPEIAKIDLTRQSEIKTPIATTIIPKPTISSKRKRDNSFEVEVPRIKTATITPPLTNSSPQDSPRLAKRMSGGKKNSMTTTPLGKEKQQPSASKSPQSDEEEVDSTPPPPSKKRKFQRSRPSFVSVNGDSNGISQKTLLARRDNFRPGHISKDNNKTTGWFSPEEIARIEKHKTNFCNEHHISGEFFDECVQTSKRDKDAIFKTKPGFVTHHEFWQAIYQLVPDRDRRSISRFMRRHFRTGNTPHLWTDQDDDELERLHRKYGPKWSIISREMERTHDDVVQRWKNKVEHRSTMKEGPWNEEELEKLVQAVEQVREVYMAEGKEDVEDIYVMDEKYVSWGAVSDFLENTRSRQQCADKWRRIKRKVMEYRTLFKKDATYRDVLDSPAPLSAKRVSTRKRDLPSTRSTQARKRQKKSKDSDNELSGRGKQQKQTENVETPDAEDSSDDEERDVSAVDNQAPNGSRDTKDSDDSNNSDNSQQSRSEDESESDSDDDDSDDSPPPSLKGVQPQEEVPSSPKKNVDSERASPPVKDESDSERERSQLQSNASERTQKLGKPDNDESSGSGSGSDSDSDRDDDSDDDSDESDNSKGSEEVDESDDASFIKGSPKSSQEKTTIRH